MGPSLKPPENAVDAKRPLRVAIIGGGSAGWMTAAALSHRLRHNLDLTLIESDRIGTVGVGEATIPPIRHFNRMLGIDEATFMARTQGSFKLGIQFVDWGQLGDRYMHPFGRYGIDFDAHGVFQHWLHAHHRGDPTSLGAYSVARQMAVDNRFSHPLRNPQQVQSSYDYAYHFDAGLYAAFLRERAEAQGVTRWEGEIQSVSRDPQSGDVVSVHLSDGRVLAADLFIDCSGFRGLLIEEALKTGFEDWSHWLPCDRALAVPCKGQKAITPYTRSTARAAGWQWRIPLQHRIGNGYVYSSAFISDDEAVDTLLSNLDGARLADPRPLRFVTGRRRKAWNHNVVALGLASGFLEPLESTSLHLIQTGIMRLLALWPGHVIDPLVREEYNRLSTYEFERIRDFIILHYKATQRTDAPLWTYTQTMSVPDSLAYKMAHFQRDGRTVSDGIELFTNASWISVYIGQNVIPRSADPALDHGDPKAAADHLRHLRTVIAETVATLPTHDTALATYCPAQPSQAAVAAT